MGITKAPCFVLILIRFYVRGAEFFLVAQKENVVRKTKKMKKNGGNERKQKRNNIRRNMENSINMSMFNGSEKGRKQTKPMNKKTKQQNAKSKSQTNSTAYFRMLSRIGAGCVPLAGSIHHSIYSSTRPFIHMSFVSLDRYAC